jgi:hypothetical protein
VLAIAQGFQWIKAITTPLNDQRIPEARTNKVYVFVRDVWDVDFKPVYRQ